MLFKRKSLGEVEEEMITLLDFIDDAFKSYYWLRTRYESVQEFIGNNENISRYSKDLYPKQV